MKWSLNFLQYFYIYLYLYIIQYKNIISQYNIGKMASIIYKEKEMCVRTYIFFL